MFAERVRSVCSATLAALVVAATTAVADPVRTTDSVELRAKPGEKEAAVATLPAGTEVVIDGEVGRWLHVRAGKRAGYLTRTAVTGLPTTGGPSGAWSAARRGGDDGARPGARAIFVEVAAASGHLRAQPSATAALVIALPTGARLAVVDAAQADWIRVRDDQGRDGWVARAELDDGAAAAARGGTSTEGAASPAIDDDAPVRAAPRGLRVRTEAGVGYRSLDMDFASNGSTGRANYAVSADAPSLDVGAEAIAGGGAAIYAVGGRARVAASSPGIDYPGPSGPPGSIPFTVFEGSAWLRAGLRARPDLAVSAVIGGHYDAFLAKDVENAGRLPRERLLGVTAGARLDFTPARSRVGVTASLDVLALGSRRQTPGLEDGQASTARALWGRVLLRYQLGARLSIYGGIDYERASTRWTGMSVRQPDVTAASRVDTSQIVQLGVGADL